MFFRAGQLARVSERQRCAAQQRALLIPVLLSVVPRGRSLPHYLCTVVVLGIVSQHLDPLSESPGLCPSLLHKERGWDEPSVWALRATLRSSSVPCVDSQKEPHMPQSLWLSPPQVPARRAGAAPCSSHCPPPAPTCSPALLTRGGAHGQGLALTLAPRALSLGCDFSLERKGMEAEP